MKIGVICSGGDSPGMNSALLAIKRTIETEKIGKLIFYKNGFRGIYEEREVDVKDTLIDISKAGTCIGTARFENFSKKEIRKKVIENLEKHEVNNLIVIGGNGSLKGAELLKKESSLNVSVIPGTIDNDFPKTDYTLGFDTALNVITKVIDQLSTTADSHERIIIMETMGRKCFSLAEKAAYANSSVWIERSSEEYLENFCQKITEVSHSPIILLPEGLSHKEKVIRFLTKKVPKETRFMNLSYLQRGASPTYYDRYIGYKWGQLAVYELEKNNSGILSQKNGKINLVPW